MIGDTTIHEVIEITLGSPMLIRRGHPDWFESQTISVTTADGGQFSLVCIGRNAQPLPRVATPNDDLVEALRLIAEWDHPTHPLFNPDSDDKPSVERFAKIAQDVLAKTEGWL